MTYTPDQLLARALDVLSRCAASVDEADACRELLELVRAGRVRVVDRGLSAGMCAERDAAFESGIPWKQRRIGRE